MKARHVFFIILLIIVADQALKIWVKTHMPLSHPWDSYYHVPVSKYDNGVKILGNKFQIYFVENEGMAWGWKFGGGLGKMALTLFRLAAVIFGVFYLRHIIQKNTAGVYRLCCINICRGAWEPA